MMSDLVDQFSDEHVQLLESINAIELDEEKILVVQTFLNKLAHAGTTVADARQRSRLRGFIRFWSSFIYDCSGLFPDVQLLPTTLDGVLLSHIDDLLQRAKLSDHKLTSAAAQDTTFAQIGPFEIIDEIGEGNFSKVYRAINTLNEDVVAVKVLQGKQLQHSPRLRELLVQREQLALTLEHPNIIPVYMATEYEGFMCTAMKLVESGSLGDRLSYWYWRPSIREILSIVQQAVEGLKYLHQIQIIHGDIKPANLLVAFDDHVYLTDFGITQVLGGAFNGMVVGTPEYLAPEAILHSDQVDGRVDLYAIGIMLYELLTGLPPFHSESPVELLHHHIHSPISPIERVNEPLNALILKCLQKNPQDRFQSAEELDGEIDKLLSSLPDGFLDLQPTSFITDPERRFKSHGTKPLPPHIDYMELRKRKIDEPTKAQEATTTDASESKANSYEHGKIGVYEIISKVGEGGFAKIYQAFDTVHSRVVALKVLDIEKIGTSQGIRDRLLEHEQHLTKLRHPNIVPVYEVIKSDGIIGIAMQLIEGGSLAERLKRWNSPPTVRTFLAIIRQVCEGLVYLHAEGIIHRDIKPDNILLSFDDHAYLTDFGTAQIIENPFHNMIVGTPAYLPPEIALHPENVDGRADIYSIGIILFEVFVGELPFEAKSPFELLHKQVNQPVPTMPSYVPKEIVKVIDKCLEKDPEERFQTAKGLRDRIEYLLATLPDTVLNSYSTQLAKTYTSDDFLICPNCRSSNECGATHCDQCGTPLTGSTHPISPPAFPSPPVALPPSGNTCPSCGNQVAPGEAFCNNCGAVLTNISLTSRSVPLASARTHASLGLCQTCGFLNEVGATFCDSCGTPLDSVRSSLGAYPPRSAAAAAFAPSTPLYVSHQTDKRDTLLLTELVASSSDNVLAILLAPSGPLMKDYFLIRNHHTRIGRGVDNDIVIHDESISKLHTLLVYENKGSKAGTFTIQDLGSANGTYIGPKRIYKQSKLRHNDSIKIGRVKFVFKQLDSKQVRKTWQTNWLFMVLGITLTIALNAFHILPTISDRARRLFGR